MPLAGAAVYTVPALHTMVLQMSLSYLPGTASLLEELDKKLMVLLRDGRTLIGEPAPPPWPGYLRSVDQFANLVLHQTIERIHVGKCYGDIPRGVFVVRGENVVLLGEIDAEKTEPGKLGLQEVSLEEILEKQAVHQAEKEEADRIRAKAFKERGLTYTSQGECEDMY